MFSTEKTANAGLLKEKDIIQKKYQLLRDLRWLISDYAMSITKRGAYSTALPVISKIV